MYNFLDDSIYECNNDNFDYDLGDICDDIYTEKTFSLPLKDYVDKIKEIKRAKPSEYEGSNKCKEFIDKYGDDIIKISKLLEKEPEELKSMEIKSALTIIGSVLAVYASIPFFGFEASFIGIAVAVISIIFGVISLIIDVFMIVRVSEATEISNELTKIETTLKKINPKTLPKSTQKKYYDILESIDDAQTAFSSRLKILKESVITDLIFEKYNEGKLSEDKMILLLEANDEAGIFKEELDSFDVINKSDMTEEDEKRDKKLKDDFKHCNSKKKKYELYHKCYLSGRNRPLTKLEYEFASKYVDEKIKNIKNNKLKRNIAAGGVAYGAASTAYDIKKGKYNPKSMLAAASYASTAVDAIYAARCNKKVKQDKQDIEEARKRLNNK